MSKIFNYANRAKTINKSILEVGNIIIVKKDGTQNSYIYIKDSLLVRKNQSGVFENYSNKSLNVFLRNLVGKNYVILRPALGELKSTQKPEDEKKDNETNNDSETNGNETKGNEVTDNNEKDDSETVDDKTNTTDNNPNKIQNSKSSINRKAFLYIISSFIVIVTLATFASHIFKLYKK